MLARRDGFADFLLGLPVSAERRNPLLPYYNFHNNFAFYVQDEWRISPRLTMTLGLRYELNPPIGEPRGKHSTFDPVTGVFIVAATDSPKPGAPFPIYLEAVDRLMAQLAGRIVPSRDRPDYGDPDSLRFTDYNGLAPRIGIAYRPFGEKSSMVIRAGYGVFHTPFSANVQSNYVLTPFNIAETVTNSTPVPDIDLRSAFSKTGNLPTPTGFDFQPRFRDGYTHSWSLSVQRQLFGGTLLDFAYVASKGTRIERLTPFNVPVPGPGAIQARRPIPYVGLMNSFQSNGNSTYQSLQIKAEKRFATGLSFLASYVYSKSIDDASTDADSPARDGYNFRLNKGPSNFDIPHVVKGTWVYELPFGRGGKFGSSMNRVANGVIGGWQIMGILTLASGEPYWPQVSTDVANIGLTNRPNRVAGGSLQNPTIDRWFDLSAFQIPAQYTIGNTGRNILRTDGLEAFDLGVSKNFRIREGMGLDFRTEFFNALNHPVFNAPNANIGTANAGIVSSASAGRIIQLGLKLNF
jgi:hypothetical protein